MPPTVEHFFERWTNPAVVVTLVSIILGNVTFTLWWARGESARITANEVATATLKSDIYAMSTPLGAKVLQIEISNQDMFRQQANMLSRIEHMDSEGTRRLGATIEPLRSNQQRNTVMLDRIIERMLETDRRINDLDSRAVVAVTRVSSRIDNIETNLKRLDERMDRVVQTLDNVNAILQRQFPQPAQPPR